MRIVRMHLLVLVRLNTHKQQSIRKSISPYLAENHWQILAKIWTDACLRALTGRACLYIGSCKWASHWSAVLYRCYDFINRIMMFRSCPVHRRPSNTHPHIWRIAAVLFANIGIWMYMAYMQRVGLCRTELKSFANMQLNYCRRLHLQHSHAIPHPFWSHPAPKVWFTKSCTEHSHVGCVIKPRAAGAGWSAGRWEEGGDCAGKCVSK